MTRSRALRAASRARAAVRHFSMIRRPSPGFSSRYWARLSADRGLDLALDLGVAELGLRLALELGLGQLDADDRGQALADVVARQVRVVVLEDAGPARPVVQRARQGGPEARDVGAAVDRVDVVGEGQDVLGVGVVVLEGDLDDGRAVAPLDVDRAVVEGLLVPVQVPDERHEAALEVERALAVDPLVDERDPDALGQVGRLAEALGDRLERVLGRLEHLADRRGTRSSCRAGRWPGPIFLTGVVGLPRAYSWAQTHPSRADSTRIHSDSALTTLTPTPWRPPDTL